MRRAVVAFRAAMETTRGAAISDGNLVAREMRHPDMPVARGKRVVALLRSERMLPRLEATIAAWSEPRFAIQDVLDRSGSAADLQEWSGFLEDADASVRGWSEIRRNGNPALAAENGDASGALVEELRALRRQIEELNRQLEEERRRTRELTDRLLGPKVVA